jgi:Zn-dependent peptidase ImmA (M78 family)/transcriptional regulator with XRE-family HTH domain
MTQVELARQLGMRPGPVNCIEKGRNLPSAKVLCRLSDVLEVSLDALFADSSVAVQATKPGAAYVAEERADYGAPQAVLARAPDEIAALPKTDLATVNRVVADFLALEDLCGAQKRAALPLNISFEPTMDGIEELAAEVRRFLGVSDAVIFDYLELLENAGLRIVFCDLSESAESIGCHDEPNGNVVIIVARGMNVERQLFRLIYELGRVYCFTRMRDLGNAVSGSCGRNIAGRKFTPDRMAKAFAALFLQPAAAVRATVRQLKIGPKDWTYELVLRLKHRFGVSAEAFLYRLKELRLIDGRLADAVQKRLYAEYEKTDFKEPAGTRRLLTPNGRLGDLLLLAEQRAGNNAEFAQIRKRLTKVGVWA